jgi:hypothetical protein
LNRRVTHATLNIVAARSGTMPTLATKVRDV